MKVTNHAAYLIAFLIIVSQVFILGWSATRHSPTTLEPAFVVAGLRHWKTGNFDLFRVNPPLPRLIATIPVFLAGYEMDWSGCVDGPGVRVDSEIGATFVDQNQERTIWLITLARWACIPFNILGGIFCFMWSREIWNSNSAGLTSLCLWCLEPTILGHGELVTSDCAASSFGVGAGYFFWKWLKDSNWQTTIVAGLLFGSAQLCKTSWTILYLLWPLIWIVWHLLRTDISISDRMRQLKNSVFQLCCLLATGVYITNIGYLCQGTGLPLGDYIFVSGALSGENPGVQGNRFVGSFLEKIVVPFPRDYISGIDLQKKDFEDFGQPSFLHGRWQNHGWWYYYLYGIGVKVPHGWQMIFLLAILAIVFCSPTGLTNRDLLVVTIPPIVIFVLVSAQLEFNLHFRYIMPMLAYGCVFSGAATKWFMSCSETAKIISTLCQRVYFVSISGLMLSVFASYPHQLAYFNELAGGAHNGGSHLRGSSFDWGQDLLLAKSWIEKNASGKYTVLYAHSYDITKIGLPPINSNLPENSAMTYIFPRHKNAWGNLQIRDTNGFGTTIPQSLIQALNNAEQRVDISPTLTGVTLPCPD